MRTDLPAHQLAFGDQLHAAMSLSVDAGTRYARMVTDVCDDEMISMVYVYTQLMDLNLTRDNTLMALSLALVRLARAGDA